MLQSLLPQVKECSEEVEVWILDNASTDETTSVLAKLKNLGPFEVKRQSQNFGPTRNIVEGPKSLAKGKYVWVLGDHNLLRPGALRQILNHLALNSQYDVFYVNYRAASYPEHWPDVAYGGFDGSYSYIGNPEIKTGALSKWSDLLRASSAVCTQNYVHIIKTEIWQNFWHSRDIGKDYTSAITTYPHTITLIENHLTEPAYAIADPCITIFNGAQSWGNPVTRVKVYFLGLTDLLNQLKTKGLKSREINELWRQFFEPEAKRVAIEAYKKTGRLRGTLLLLKHLGWNINSWRVFLVTVPEGWVPRISAMFSNLMTYLANYRHWYIYNFRPSRILRKFFEANRSKR
jgi:glycosyltransferase involved in cell wall biosynthesis